MAVTMVYVKGVQCRGATPEEETMSKKVQEIKDLLSAINIEQKMESAKLLFLTE